jgi:hypothetical protein
VGQLSFFTADFRPPQVADLGGLLAAHGPITVSPGGARLSILVAEPARAVALVGESEVRQISAEVVDVDGSDPQLLMRTERTPALLELSNDWTRGAVKGVPDLLGVTAGFLRIWAIAAGRMDDSGYLLGLDPHTPETTEALIAACARAGIAGSYIGVRGGGPGIRIVGHRRLARLIDTIGTLPSDLPADCYPVEPRVVGEHAKART